MHRGVWSEKNNTELTTDSGYLSSKIFKMFGTLYNYIFLYIRNDFKKMTKDKIYFENLPLSFSLSIAHSHFLFYFIIF